MKKERVVAAMSGGVDSSSAAVMLSDAGYEVIGITIQLWPKAVDESGRKVCCGLDAIENARKVCRRIGIPHYVLDMRKMFRRKVIDNFCGEYKNGRTPNPCIQCNRHIKFSALLIKAQALGADFIATGHYARVCSDNKTGRYLLKKAVSDDSDQSYVLYTFTQYQLAHTILPLGTFSKKEVRNYASKKGLHNSMRKASQDICFTGGKDYRRFIKENMEDYILPGDIIDTEGNVIGMHNGLPFYTVGQRGGLGISSAHPLYVIKIDKGNNRLVVGTEDKVYNSVFKVNNVNIIRDGAIREKIGAQVKIRYLHKEQEADIYPLADGDMKVVFRRPQRAVTPGQSAVFYSGETVIGGGIIDKVLDGYDKDCGEDKKT